MEVGSKKKLLGKQVPEGGGRAPAGSGQGVCVNTLEPWSRRRLKSNSKAAMTLLAKKVRPHEVTVLGCVTRRRIHLSKSGGVHRGPSSLGLSWVLVYFCCCFIYFIHDSVCTCTYKKANEKEKHP